MGHHSGFSASPSTVKSFGNRRHRATHVLNKQIHRSLLSLGTGQPVCITGLGADGRGTVQKDHET